MKLYLAAALDTEGDRASNARLTRDLEAAGHTVYLPQRDGGLYPERSASQVFSADVDALAQCDVLVARWRHDTHFYPDSGQAFELGYASALGKPCLVLDLNASFENKRTNPMLTASVRAVCYSGAELVTYLALQGAWDAAPRVQL